MTSPTKGPYRICQDKGPPYLAAQGDNWKKVAVILEQEDANETMANARLLAVADALLAQLRSLEHLASVLNGRQHAGLCITPTMWSTLYQECERARAFIAIAEGTKHDQAQTPQSPTDEP